MAMRSCESCGEYFDDRDKKRKRNPRKRFCTRRCWLSKYNREDREHTMSGAFAAGAVNKANLRGTGDKASYVKEDGRHQHRVVVERLLGRELRSGEIVHHEDKNGRNNNPSNLWVFESQADHAHHHGAGHLENPSKCHCNAIRFKK